MLNTWYQSVVAMKCDWKNRTQMKLCVYRQVKLNFPQENGNSLAGKFNNNDKKLTTDFVFRRTRRSGEGTAVCCVKTEYLQNNVFNSKKLRM